MRLFSFCLFFLFSSVLFGQSPLTWLELANLEIEEVRLEEDFITYNKATFGEDLQKKDSTEVYIKGYLIPIDPMGLTYALSQNPNASCFFCGGAGPETVILLRIAPKAYKRYKTDTRKTFKGILQMNENDLNSFIYVLKNAEEY